MTLDPDRALDRLPPPSRIDRGVPGVFHRGDHGRRSRRRRSTWPLRERRLGSRLERKLAGSGVVLHSRRAEPGLDCEPIDHLVVLPAGVWVVAADHGLERFSVEATTASMRRLDVRVRDQAAACREVIAAIGFDWLDVYIAVCATNASGMHRRSVEIDGIWMTRPGGLLTLLAQPGPLSHLDVATVAAELSRRFPAAR